MWKVTTKLIMNGAPMPVEVKNRCLSAEQAGDLVKTFGPEVASVNTECKSERAMKEGRLKWQMQCRGTDRHRRDRRLHLRQRDALFRDGRDQGVHGRAEGRRIQAPRSKASTRGVSLAGE